MAEYGREQRNKLSRAVGSNKSGCKPVEGIIDNSNNRVRHSNLIGLINLHHTSTRIIQCVNWGDWLKKLNDMHDDENTRIIKLGMVLVEFLRKKGIDAKLGGSLAAMMEGGTRVPHDIDIDYSNKDISVADVKQELKDKSHDYPFVLANDLFFIENIATEQGVLKIKYYMGTVPLDGIFDEDLIFDDDKVSAARDAADKKTYENTVDINPEEIFTTCGVVPDSDDLGYYGPNFLIASYLNRLVSSEEDQKGDRVQIKDILRKMIDDSKIKNLNEYKDVIMSKISEKNPKKNNIHILLDAIVSEM